MLNELWETEISNISCPQRALSVYVLGLLLVDTAVKGIELP